MNVYLIHEKIGASNNFAEGCDLVRDFEFLRSIDGEASDG